MHRGYARLWRKLRDNPLWLAEPFTKGQAWIDLILLANHKKNLVDIRGILVTIQEGQVLAGSEYLGKRWKWSRGKVIRFLNYLETPQPNPDSTSSEKTVQQIVQQKNNVCTVISIVNWERYQGNGTANRTADGQQTDSRRTADGHTEALLTLQTLQEEEKPPKPPSAKKTPKFIITLPYQSEQFKDAWDGLLEVRKLKKAPDTERALNGVLSKLGRLAKNEKTAIELLDDAIQNGWKTVFERKGFDNKPDPEVARKIEKEKDAKDAERMRRVLQSQGVNLPNMGLERKL